MGFYEALYVVLSAVGVQALRTIRTLKPLLPQAFASLDEHVVARALSTLSGLLTSKLIDKRLAREFLSDILPLLLHPSMPDVNPIRHPTPLAASASF